jgi:hypothetical protein
MAANAAAEAKKKKSEMTKKFLADKYAQMKLDREAKALRRTQLEGMLHYTRFIYTCFIIYMLHYTS